MNSKENLHDKLKEIEEAIDASTFPDGTCRFDYDQAWIALELVLRLINND